jgi:hypothetical protein
MNDNYKIYNKVIKILFLFVQLYKLCNKFVHLLRKFKIICGREKRNYLIFNLLII